MKIKSFNIFTKSKVKSPKFFSHEEGIEFLKIVEDVFSEIIDDSVNSRIHFVREIEYNKSRGILCSHVEGGREEKYFHHAVKRDILQPGYFQLRLSMSPEYDLDDIIKKVTLLCERCEIDGLSAKLDKLSSWIDWGSECITLFKDGYYKNDRVDIGGYTDRLYYKVVINLGVM